MPFKFDPNLLSSKAILITFFVLFSSGSVVFAQSSGQCTANVFVEGTIAGFGGTAVMLTMDAQDNLYIADNVNNAGALPQGPLVFKVTPQGAISLIVPPGELGDVTGLAFDAQGNLYVADGNGNGNGQPQPKNMVWKVSPSGVITPFISGVNNPTGLAFDEAQNLYVASFNDQAVYKYSLAGAFLGVVTSGLPDGPYGIALDAAGNLFVAGFAAGGAASGNAFGTRIYKVTPQGERSVFVDPGFPDPHSLVFDQQGYLYASYYNSLKILRIAPDGSYTVFPGGCSGDDAANGLAIDSNGTLYAVVNGGRTTAQQAVLKIYGVVPGSSPPSTSFPRLTVPGNMLFAAESPSGSVVNYNTTAVDENFASATVTCSHPSGSIFPIGTTQITCTAVDGSGNFSAPATFHITVVDGPPNLFLPSDFEIGTSSAGAQVLYVALADDTLSGPVPVQCSPASGVIFPIGNTTVNCSATDGAGNTASGSFNIHVFTSTQSDG
ncbi:MAG TPA: HYR domain-containing protein, partial [Blastocatellia bacterium]|nr:HYR domain-containing protein [Blastocatellia bacterium]